MKKHLLFLSATLLIQTAAVLYKAGAAAIFGPGTSVAKAACQIMELLLAE